MNPGRDVERTAAGSSPRDGSHRSGCRALSAANPVLSRGFKRTLIESSVYLDEANRARDLYLGGYIDVEEFERRVAEALKQPPPRDMGNMEQR